jgi:hypothetical protein
MAGKKKGKVKFRNAEEARKARELDESWKQLQKKYVAKINVSSTNAKFDDLSIPEGRNTTAHIKSKVTEGGTATLQPAKVYTGDKMLGIGQLHKSNAVPVFSSDEVVNIARMRR